MHRSSFLAVSSGPKVVNSDSIEMIIFFSNIDCNEKNETGLKNSSNKKSTILFQIAWDSGNIIYSWASHFDKVS